MRAIAERERKEALFEGLRQKKMPARLEEIKKLKEWLNNQDGSIQISYLDNNDNDWDDTADTEGGLENDNACKVTIKYHFDDYPNRTEQDIITEKIPIINAPDNFSYDNFYKLEGFGDSLFVGEFKTSDEDEWSTILFNGWRIVGDKANALFDIVSYKKQKEVEDKKWKEIAEAERLKIQLEAEKSYAELKKRVQNGWITIEDALWLYNKLFDFDYPDRPKKPKSADKGEGGGNVWYNKYRKQIEASILDKNYGTDDHGRLIYNGLDWSKIK